MLNLLQESYFIYDRSSLVKNAFISQINKFLPIYCSVSNFPAPRTPPLPPQKKKK